MNTPPYDKGKRLMSIIDTAFFDYLIGNVYIDAHYGIVEPFIDISACHFLII